MAITKEIRDAREDRKAIEECIKRLDELEKNSKQVLPYIIPYYPPYQQPPYTGYQICPICKQVYNYLHTCVPYYPVVWCGITGDAVAGDPGHVINTNSTTKMVG